MGSHLYISSDEGEQDPSPFTRLPTYPTDDDDEVEALDLPNINNRFQQRLLRAQQLANEKEIEKELSNYKKHQDSTSSKTTSKELKKEYNKLKQELKQAEKETELLREQVHHWKEKRRKQASLMNLTPKERAEMVANQDNERVTKNDVDTLFDYFFELALTPLPSNSMDNADMPTFMNNYKEMKEEALNSPTIQQQANFSHIKFTEMETWYDEDVIEYDLATRHSRLVGKSYDSPFKITYDIAPTLDIVNLDFELDPDLSLDATDILQRIKMDCNLLTLFRLIKHYGRLKYDMQHTFDFLISYYTSTEIHVTREGENALLFSGPIFDDPKLTLTWKYETFTNYKKEDVDVNICEQVIPLVQLTMDAPWKSEKLHNLMIQIPERFRKLASEQGVIIATQIIVGAILIEPLRKRSQTNVQ